jgi:L-threonylcarbamoyladenylate synthase
VIAVTRDGLEVLRPGMTAVAGAVAVGPEESPEGEAHRAPGLHRKHYSPRTRIVLVSRGHLPKEGRGAYLWMDYNAAATVKVRMAREPGEYAAGLYETLHRMDREGLDWIAVEMPPEREEWAAVRDRLRRAGEE